MKVSVCSFSEFGGDIFYSVVPSSLVDFAFEEAHKAFSNQPTAGLTSRKNGSAKIVMPDNLIEELSEIYKLNFEKNKNSELRRYKDYSDFLVGGQATLDALKAEDFKTIVKLEVGEVGVTGGSPDNDFMLAIKEWCPEFERNRDAIKWCEENNFTVDKEEPNFAVY